MVGLPMHEYDVRAVRDLKKGDYVRQKAKDEGGTYPIRKVELVLVKGDRARVFYSTHPPVLPYFEDREAGERVTTYVL